jgi:hypothetical protein
MQDLEQRIDAVAAREERLLVREAAVQHLQDKEADITAQLSAAASRSQALADAEEELQRRAVAADNSTRKREADLAALRRVIEDERRRCNERESAVEELESELEAREEELSAREAALDDATTDLQQRLGQVADRESAVLAKQRELQTQRSQLSKQQQQTDRERATLALRLAAVESALLDQSGEVEGESGGLGSSSGEVGSGKGTTTSSGSNGVGTVSSDKLTILHLRQRVIELEEDAEVEGRQLKAVFMLREVALTAHAQLLRGAMCTWQRHVTDVKRAESGEWRSLTD